MKHSCTLLYLLLIGGIHFTLLNFIHAKTIFEKDSTDPIIYKDSLSSKLGALVYDNEKTGESEVESIKVYAPIKKVDSSINASDFHFFLNLPTVKTNPTVSMLLSHDDQSQDRYFVVGIKKGEGNYEVVNRSLAAYSSGTIIYYPFSKNDLCKVACGLPSEDSVDVNSSIFIYITATPIDINEGDNFGPAEDDYKDGVYFELKFNSNFESTLSPVIDALNTGDEQLFLRYNAGTLGTEYKDNITKIFVYSISDKANPAIGEDLIIDTDAEKRTYRQITTEKIPILRDEPGENNGVMTITNLTNEKSYNLAIAFVNKYQFVTKSSLTFTGKPQTLDAFLDDQNCYLVSASFQTNHYVLESFRDFRDQYLMNFSWGRSFVDYYYETAPQYTPFIIKNPAIAAVIRIMAYSVYFLFMKGGVLIVFLLLLLRYFSLGKNIIFRSKKGL